jgi:hypothetical protein
MRCVARSVALSLVLCVLASCRFETTIDSKGAGTMRVVTRVTAETQLEPTKKRMTSPSVQVTSATIDKDKWATFDLKFDDITKLPTASFFAGTTIKLSDGPEGTRVLEMKHTNANPSKLAPELITYFGNEVKIALTVPGSIVKSNATSVQGSTATWDYTLDSFDTMKSIESTITFAPAGAAPSGAKEPEKGAAEKAAAPAPTKGKGK